MNPESLDKIFRLTRGRSFVHSEYLTARERKVPWNPEAKNALREYRVVSRTQASKISREGKHSADIA